MGLRPFASWDCGFESLRKHGCLFIGSVVFCEVEVSETDGSLVQRGLTEGARTCVIECNMFESNDQ